MNDDGMANDWEWVSSLRPKMINGRLEFVPQTLIKSTFFDLLLFALSPPVSTSAIELQLNTDGTTEA